jgi:hypothetical protein
MSPREIEVHIEELVLHGFAPGARRAVGDALQSELQQLLAERGIPQAWRGNPETIEAGTIPATAQTKPVTTGGQIARAVYQAESR